MNTSLRTTRRQIICCMVGIWLLPLGAHAQPAPSRLTGTKVPAVKIRISIGDRSIPITLDDNPTARDLLALLPLTLTLEDYASTEKIATLPRRLSTAEAPEGSTPETGDFSYYAPWGNLAIFYKPFRYSPGLVRLGRIDSGLEILRTEGQMSARIELMPR